MTAPDELERVWRVVEAIPAINDLSAQYQNDIAEAILSERAELLATVERMREQVELQKRRVDRRDEKIDRMRAAYNCLLADTDPTSKAHAALTTGEGK